MSTDFEPSPLQRHVLAAGQQLDLRLSAGSTVHVRRGSLTLHEAPRWVGETMLRPAARLAEGQAHALGDTGWISLQAGAERCELWCCAPVSRWQTATRRWPSSLRSLWLTAVAAVRGSGPRSADGC